MAFGDVFGKTWKNYKDNFRTIFKLMIFFYAIPAIIVGFIQFFYFGASNLSEIGVRDVRVAGSLVLLSIGFFLISMIATLGILASSLRKERFSYSDTLSDAKRYYWKYLGFILVAGIFVVLLFLIPLGLGVLLWLYAGVIAVAVLLGIVLAIPGAVLAVSWLFGAYILVDEKRGILKSLGRSYRLVKRRWWRIFGNWVLLAIILLGVGIVFSLPGIPTALKVKSGVGVTYNLLLFHTVLSGLLDIASAFVTVPFGILFFKNLYFVVKKEGEAKVKKKRKR